MKDWYWEKRSLPSQGTYGQYARKCTGAQVWEALFAEEPTTVLLESPTTVLSKISRYSIAAGKPRQIWTPAVGEILPCLRELRSRAICGAANNPNLPFAGGYLGWVGYDLAWEIEKLPYLKSDVLPFPVAFWYEPECFAVVDHHLDLVWLAASSLEQLEELKSKLSNISLDSSLSTVHRPPPTSPSIALSTSIHFSPDCEGYEAIVRQAQAHIQAGDIFQANLSLRYSTEWLGNGWDLYKHLQQINPSPFASYWRTQWGEVISVSPERLVRSHQNGCVETRPIAGTRPRGATQDLDLALEQELISNLKERAEHIMLVDLERNDLGRVCEYGSVCVDELLAIERYSHVMHIVSNVVGKLRSDRTEIDLIAAVFPGGTITGCPKVRCMEIIETLEPQRRNLFYGSCGYINRQGNLDLNILIRTLLKCGNQIYGQVGAGIVADSIPEREWQESLQKAKAQLAALASMFMIISE